MGLFGLLNYEDYILKTVVTSNYAQQALTVSLMYTITTILRFHITLLLCWLCNWGFYSGLVLPIIISVGMSFMSTTVYEYVAGYRTTCEAIVRYFMTHYSERQLIVWKRWFLSFMVLYCALALCLITVDNTYLATALLQAVRSFVLCDAIEQGQARLFVYKVRYWITDVVEKPSVCIHEDNFSVIDDYAPQKLQEELPKIADPVLQEFLDDCCIVRSHDAPIATVISL